MEVHEQVNAKHGKVKRNTAEWHLLVTLREAHLIAVAALEKYLGMSRSKPRTRLPKKGP